MTGVPQPTRPTADEILRVLRASMSHDPDMTIGKAMPVIQWLHDQIESGAVIVHPDDVPMAFERYPDANTARGEGMRHGYDECRRTIFGDDA